MTDTVVQYYLNKDKLIDIRIDPWTRGKLYVSIYEDHDKYVVGYFCNKKELKGLADFIYETIGKK